MLSNFPSKIVTLGDNLEKYGLARQDTDDSIIQHMHIAH